MIEFIAGTSSVAPNDGRFAEFEEYYGVTLPMTYRQLTGASNGGIPVQAQFRQGDRERLIERMLCMLNEEDFARLRDADDELAQYEIDVVVTQLGARLVDDEDADRERVLPIAALFAGDFVCLDYRLDPKSPSVAVWDHERSKDFKPHLETVAPSFDAFLKLLHA